MEKEQLLAKDLTKQKPDLEPLFKMSATRRELVHGKSRVTCQFCTSYQNNLCAKKKIGTHATKPRICHKFERDTLREQQHYATKDNTYFENKVDKDGVVTKEKKPIVIWKQTDAFYEKQYTKKWHKRGQQS